MPETETAAGRVVREALEFAFSTTDEECRDWLAEHDPEWLAKFEAERQQQPESDHDA